MASAAITNAPSDVGNDAVNNEEGLEVAGGEVQAIESLCMNCHEQVCANFPFSLSFSRWALCGGCGPGIDAPPPHLRASLSRCESLAPRAFCRYSMLPAPYAGR